MPQGFLLIRFAGERAELLISSPWVQQGKETDPPVVPEDDFT